MTIPIHPGALKSYRARSKMKQDQLEKATKSPNKVSLPTIKRIESYKKGVYHARDSVALGLATALRVNVEDLSNPPSETEDKEDSLRKYGHRSLRTMIDAETALAFNMVQHMYGIPIRSQIEMAPLFASLLVEGSFAWRRNNVSAIEEAASRLRSLNGGHMSFTNAVYRVEDGASLERDSIAKRDVFGKHVSDDAYEFGYDPSENNPFADYLAVFAKDVEATSVIFEKDLGWKTGEGMPHYRIGAEIIEQLTGSDADAEYALLRGHVKLKEIPEELKSDDKEAERVAWMIAKIPEEELADRRAELNELMAKIGPLDLGENFPSQNTPEGDDHA